MNPCSLPPGPFNLPPGVTLEDIDPDLRDENESKRQDKEDFDADYDLER